MMKEIAQRSTVYLVTGYSDLRKGIDGLCLFTKPVSFSAENVVTE